jgi:hypothetical protein
VKGLQFLTIRLLTLKDDTVAFLEYGLGFAINCCWATNFDLSSLSLSLRISLLGGKSTSYCCYGEHYNDVPDDNFLARILRLCKLNNILSFTITKKSPISHSSWKFLSFALLWNTHFPPYWGNCFIANRHTHTHTDTFEINKKNASRALIVLLITLRSYLLTYLTQVQSNFHYTSITSEFTCFSRLISL